MKRPPSSYADRQIWTQRETLTTDGSGWWASGYAEAITPTGLVLNRNMTADINRKGPILTRGLSLLTLKVCQLLDACVMHRQMGFYLLPGL